jgi:MoaA/NifB/PqqE/SkfB family radical SAM enzyme
MNGHKIPPPKIIDIEICNICNYNCTVCTCGNGKLNRPKGVLNFTNFKRIADILLAEQVGATIRINCIGEPFLNKYIYEILQYGFTSNLFGTTPVLLNTNASILDAKKLKQFGTGIHLQISLDSIYPEIYKIYRNNKEKYYEQAIKNIKDVARENIPATLFTLVTRHNEDHLDAILQFGNNVGLQVVFLPFHCSPFNVLHSQLPAGVNIEDNYITRAFVTKEDFDAFSPVTPHASEYIVYSATKNPSIYQRHGTNKISCNYTAISWIGTFGEVIPCCLEAYYNTLTFGNIIKQNTFIDIWESEKYVKFRRQLINRTTASHSPCRICFK